MPPIADVSVRFHRACSEEQGPGAHTFPLCFSGRPARSDCRFPEPLT
jgi:hypothetical protein